jgi:hypothetical protein
MPLCPQITNTPVTVVQNSDFTVSSVLPVVAANTEQLAEVAVDATTALDTANDAIAEATIAIANANTAIANAATANAAATAAAFDAGVAQATADGKAKVNYSTSAASGPGSNGDIWFQVNGSGAVIAQFVYNGGWIVAPITNTVIANLDAGKITAGTITGIAYNNGSGTFSVSPAGNLVASSAIITGQITATSGTFTGAVFASSGTFTGTVTATSGSFTGTINSTSGTIGGFTLDGGSLFSGNLTLSSSGTITGGNSSTLFYGFVNVGGGFPTGDRFQVNGTSNFNGTLTGLDIRAIGDLFAAGHSTTSNAANGFIVTTGGRILRSTASSERYKENIVDLAQVPELDPKKLLDLPVRAFTYKENELSETDDRYQQMIPGFIAEEVDAIYPVAADYVDGPESWNDRVIVPALLSLVQDLYKEIQTIKGA